jgi:hypothetical protein
MLTETLITISRNKNWTRINSILVYSDSKHCIVIVDIVSFTDEFTAVWIFMSVLPGCASGQLQPYPILVHCTDYICIEMKLVAVNSIECHGKASHKGHENSMENSTSIT